MVHGIWFGYTSLFLSFVILFCPSSPLSAPIDRVGVGGFGNHWLTIQIIKSQQNMKNRVFRRFGNEENLHKNGAKAAKSEREQVCQNIIGHLQTEPELLCRVITGD